jgi:hypothetical protein
MASLAEWTKSLPERRHATHRNPLSGMTGDILHGMTGMTGDSSLSGMTGMTGDIVDGMTGMTGDIVHGMTGMTGDSSLSGTTGMTGITVDGMTGITGDTVRGITGDTVRGMTGMTGITGMTGTIGHTGTIGETATKVVGDIFIVIGNEAFDLKQETTTLLQGGPTIYARDAFYERFTPNTKIFNTVVKYWRTDRLTAYSPSRSEPTKNTFRVPCVKSDADILMDGFTSYHTFLERKVKSFNKTGTDEEHFWEGERDHVGVYISKLKAWNKNDKTCISLSEVAEDSSILYYAVIPKLFYLLYLNSQSQIPLNIQAIFKKFPTLDKDAKEYLQQLTEAGTFETERGLYDMATGVVELFYMLPILFPDLYGHLIPDQESTEKLAALLKSGKSVPEAIKSTTQSVNVGVGDSSVQPVSMGVGDDSIKPTVNLDIVDNLLKDVKFPEALKTLISNGLKAALQAYTEKDTKKVTTEIQQIVTYLDAYMAKLDVANAEIKTLRDEIESLKTEKASEEKTEIISLLKTIDTNVKTIQSQADEIAKLLDIIKTLTESLKQAKGQDTIDGIQTKLQEALNKLLVINTDLEKTKLELNSEKDKTSQFTVENTDLKEQIVAALAVASKAAAEAQAALDLANAAAAAAKVDLDAAKAKATEDLNKARGDAATAATLAQEQVTKLTAEIDELKTKSGTDQSALGDLLARLEAATAAQTKALSDAEAATDAALAAKTAAEKALADAQAKAISDAAAATDAALAAKTAAEKALADAQAKAISDAADAYNKSAETDVRRLSELQKASTEAIELKGDKARLEGLVNECKLQCGNSKKELYRDIMTQIKEWMVDLKEAVPNLVKPSDLPGALTVQLEKPDVDYDSTKGLDEQENMTYIFEEIEALRLYLGALNNKYTQWITVFENKSKIRTREKRVMTQEQLDSLFKFLYDIIRAYTRVGATKADIPDAVYNRKTVKNDLLTKGLITTSVNLVLNSVLNGMRLPESASTTYHEKFLSILIATHTKASKSAASSAELNRLRRFVMILFKLAYRFINAFYCEDDDGDCADTYIDDVYDNFNTRMTLQDNISMMNILFNGSTAVADTIKDIFYLYLISDPIVDTEDSIFWSTGKDAHKLATPSTPATHFYNIDWKNVAIIKQFYKTMIGVIDARIATAKSQGKNQQGGSIKMSPHDLTPMLAEQEAWDTVINARNDLEPEYRKLLPEADPAPINSLVEPFNKYIAENADPEDLEEARNAVGMMSKDDIETALNDDMNNTEPLNRVTPMYTKALPRVGKAWIPIMVRADMLRMLLNPL